MLLDRQKVEDMLDGCHIVSDGEYCGYCCDDIDLDSCEIAPYNQIEKAVQKWNNWRETGYSHSTMPNSIFLELAYRVLCEMYNDNKGVDI